MLCVPPGSLKTRPFAYFFRTQFDTHPLSIGRRANVCSVLLCLGALCMSWRSGLWGHACAGLSGRKAGRSYLRRCVSPLGGAKRRHLKRFSCSVRCTLSAVPRPVALYITFGRAAAACTIDLLAHIISRTSSTGIYSKRMTCSHTQPL